jgi:hypothetical protein
MTTLATTAQRCWLDHDVLGLGIMNEGLEMYSLRYFGPPKNQIQEIELVNFHSTSQIEHIVLHPDIIIINSGRIQHHTGSIGSGSGHQQLLSRSIEQAIKQDWCLFFAGASNQRLQTAWELRC